MLSGAYFRLLLGSTLFSFFTFTGLHVQALNAQIVHQLPIYQDLAKAEEDFNYIEYYQVKVVTSSKVVNLIDFEKKNTKFPMPKDPYNRTLQFGTWIHPQKNNCLNTRGIVLERDSRVQITTNQHCTVQTGDWNDPYTNQNFNDASDIQIDHLVPLKNAYMTGAHEWDNTKRCLYANFLGNDFHLLSVFGSENMKKGDKSPREYMPPNKDYTCQYLHHWLEVKYIWKLRMTPAEMEKIKTEFQASHCEKSNFLVPAAEMQKQLSFIEKNKNLCSPSPE